jgi:hypothetical protein
MPPVHTDAMRLDRCTRRIYSSVAGAAAWTVQPGPPVTMTRSQDGALSMPIGGQLQAVGERNQPGMGRDGADLDLRRDPARHRQHAECGEVDRLDAVVEENAKPHDARSILFRSMTLPWSPALPARPPE